MLNRWVVRLRKLPAYKLIEMPSKETCDKLLRKKVTAEHNS